MHTYMCNKDYPETISIYAHIYHMYVFFCEFHLKNFETVKIKVFHTFKLQCESTKWQKKIFTNVRLTAIDESHLGFPTKPKSTLG